MSTTEILLIRHGETDWNLERRLQGHLDIGLNAKGLLQAQALKQSLEGVPLDAVFCSDLQRARQTAAALASSRGLALQIDAGLRERCFGALEGLRYEEAAERFPAAYAAMRRRDIDARYPAGVYVAETGREFSQRSVGTLMRLLGSGDYRRVAIVTHGGVLDSIYRFANGMDYGTPRSFEVFNAGINRLSWNIEQPMQLRIDGWGDVTHLDAIALDEIDR
ncbi:histidine phosphatase family protein [Paraherbaspirillum soli]|uniref:Histidine phosphatase family protein n=1 Tax=Paraherbaspirillum soli TaxID=631222 RepID=A0ABW0MEA3_9BURK